jgi:hypothetical protein
MNCEELERQLEAAGCSRANYSVGTRGNDTFCLEKVGDEWWVFYTERGMLNDPEYRSASEAEACAYLWEKMQNIRHDHLAGAFTDQAHAQAFAQSLQRLGMPHHCDQIPFPVLNPPLFRVFVYGAAIFDLRKRYGSLPVRQWPAAS